MHTSSGVSNGWGSSGCYCLINLSTKTDYIVVHAKDQSAESYNASHREEALSPFPPNLYINLWQLLKSFKLLVVSIFNCNATLLFIVHQWNLPKKKRKKEEYCHIMWIFDNYMKFHLLYWMQYWRPNFREDMPNLFEYHSISQLWNCSS